MSTTEDGSVESIILGLPADQQRAVAAALTKVASQVEAARDACRNDPSPRWGGLAEGAHIVGSAAAYARGVAGLPLSKGPGREPR